MLCAVLLLGTLAGCRGGTDPSLTEGESTAEQTRPEGPKLVLIGGTKARVVYPAAGSKAETDAALGLRDRIRKLTGTDPGSGDDFIAAWQTHDSETAEILVGITSYPESAEVLAGLSGIDEYAVRVVGKKLVVASRSEKGLREAIAELEKKLAGWVSDGFLSVPCDLSLTGNVNVSGENLPMLDTLKKTQLVEGDAGSSTMLIYETADGDVEAYGKLLEAEGYTLRTSNELLGTKARSRSYVSDQRLVTVFRSDADATMRVMSEPLSSTALLPFEPQAYEKKCEPKFYFIGVGNETDPAGNGMSMMFRLADGRFLVWDGGHDDGLADSVTAMRQNGARILDIMKKEAPDPNDLRVAGWFITHPHIDHGGAIQYFGSHFLSDSVRIESIIAYLPSYSQSAAYTDGMTYAKVVGYLTFFEKMRERGTAVVQAHPGQVFCFADARVEVLYTDDLMLPAVESESNPLSVVCRVTLGGTSFLITGDTTASTGGKFCQEMYGEALRSDFLQLPHHCFNVMADAFYRSAAPKYLLCPVSTHKLDGNKLNRVLGVLPTKLPDENVYIAGFSTAAFPLPFSGTGVSVTANQPIG